MPGSVRDRCNLHRHRPRSFVSCDDESGESRINPVPPKPLGSAIFLGPTGWEVLLSMVIGIMVVFGLMNLIAAPLNLDIAVPKPTTMQVGKREIQRLLQEEPAFSQMFLSHILTRKDRVEEDLFDQLFNRRRSGSRDYYCC